MEFVTVIAFLTPVKDQALIYTILTREMQVWGELVAQGNYAELFSTESTGIELIPSRSQMLPFSKQHTLPTELQRDMHTRT
jgi:hypothetical protein